MDFDSKIYIAGHTGLVGSAIHRKLIEKGYKNFVFTPFPEFDLTNQIIVRDFFRKEKPDYVFLAAAKVGGIFANDKYRADFIYQNLQIQNNVIHFSFINRVKKLLFLGSSCIYPKNCPQPIKEDYFLTNELEYTNEPYAVAKIAGIKLCESYNIQYGTNFIIVLPTNLFGPYDNYNFETSHFLPAILRKMHLGKCIMNDDWKSIRKDLNQRPVEDVTGKSDKKEILEKLAGAGINLLTGNKVSITVWGSGMPRRDFLYSEELADACIYLMQNVNFRNLIVSNKEIRNTHINIGSGTDFSILELVNIVKEIVEFKGDIEWDRTKPDGVYQKLMDIERLKSFGWNKTYDLRKGISDSYMFYLNQL
jgi:GDP-L-fucose synthase